MKFNLKNNFQIIHYQKINKLNQILLIQIKIRKLYKKINILIQNNKLKLLIIKIWRNKIIKFNKILKTKIYNN